MATFQVGDCVRCAPSGIMGVVYTVAPGVVYVKLGKGEVITSPHDMLDLVKVASTSALQGNFTCWRCGAELPETGDVCASCGENQVPF